MSGVKVELQRLYGAQFKGTNEAGASIMLAGSPEVGESEEGLRPMQALLASLAACSAIDVLQILQKGRHTVTRLEVSVDGERADAVPAVFTKIHLHFTASGDFPLHKLERAVALSQDKYCSISHMLRGSVAITTSVALADLESRPASEPERVLDGGAHLADELRHEVQALDAKAALDAARDVDPVGR
jgi:putative redox protein